MFHASLSIFTHFPKQFPHFQPQNFNFPLEFSLDLPSTFSRSTSLVVIQFSLPFFASLQVTFLLIEFKPIKLDQYRLENHSIKCISTTKLELCRWKLSHAGCRKLILKNLSFLITSDVPKNVFLLNKNTGMFVSIFGSRRICVLRLFLENVLSPQDERKNSNLCESSHQKSSNLCVILSRIYSVYL